MRRGRKKMVKAAQEGENNDDDGQIKRDNYKERLKKKQTAKMKKKR